MNRSLPHAVRLFVVPFVVAVNLAATPAKVEQVQAGLAKALAQKVNNLVYLVDFS